MCDCCELTDDDKEFVEEVLNLLDQKQSLEEAVAAGDVGGQEAETRWKEMLRAVERAGMSDLLEAADVDAERIWIGDDEYYRVDSLSGEKSYLGSAGEVPANRTVYRKAGEHNAPLVCPLELRWGMVDGKWTPRCARSIGYLGQQMPYSQAAETAEKLGELPYSASSFERMTTRLGGMCDDQSTAIDKAVLEDLTVPDEAASIVVSVDRVSVAIDEADPVAWRDGRQADGDIHFRMAWCATICLCDGHGEPLWTRRLGEMPTDGAAEIVGEKLSRQVRALRQRDDSLQIVCLSDGATELGDLLDTYIIEPEWSGDAVRLVDAFHLYGYLGEAARAHYEDPNEARLQMGGWRLELMNTPEAIELIELQMQMWEDRDTVVDGDQPIESALTYIANHKAQMNYAPHRARGQPVGTGHVEATCKSLVQLRMKRNGQRWKHEGGQAVMKLRSLALSDGWEAGVTQLLETYQTDDAIYARKRVA